MPSNETRDTVLDVAQELLQTRGFNAFSFHDVAERVKIKTASIHYYFPTKIDLCLALIARQRDEVKAALDRIDAEVHEPTKKLARYVTLFRSTLEMGNRMCLCGMLAADFETLDPLVAEKLRLSFEDHEIWLKRVFMEGKRIGKLDFAGSPRNEARLLLSCLEGAMLVARTFEDLSRFDSSARSLLSRLRPRPNP